MREVGQSWHAPSPLSIANAPVIGSAAQGWGPAAWRGGQSAGDENGGDQRQRDCGEGEQIVAGNAEELGAHQVGERRRQER